MAVWRPIISIRIEDAEKLLLELSTSDDQDIAAVAEDALGLSAPDDLDEEDEEDSDEDAEEEDDKK